MFLMYIDRLTKFYQIKTGIIIKSQIADRLFKVTCSVYV